MGSGIGAHLIVARYTPSIKVRGSLSQIGSSALNCASHRFCLRSCFHLPLLLILSRPLCSHANSPHASASLPDTAPTSKDRTNASEQDQSPIIGTQSPTTISDHRTQFQQLNAGQPTSDIPNPSCAIHESIDHARADRLIMLRSFLFQILDPPTPSRTLCRACSFRSQ